MNRLRRSIAAGLLLAMGVAGCSQEGTPSVPSGSGADAAKKPENAPPAEKRSKSSGPATALD